MAPERNIWQLPPGASFSPAISLLATKSIASEIYGMVSKTMPFRTNSGSATPMHVLSVRTAGQECIVRVDVQQTPITQAEVLRVYMNTDASFSKKELNVLL